MLSNAQFCNSQNLPRRAFFKTSGLTLGAIGMSGIGSTTAGWAEGAWPAPSRNLIGTGETILFQGDSITDAGRSREHASEPNEQPALGSGYAWLAAVELLVQRPNGALKIYNRGISGNKVFQLADRWQADCLDLKPTLLSILIGVNDIWHTLNGTYKGTVEIYERDYRALLERTRKELPKLKLVICEPFVLRCGSVNEKWFPEFDAYRAAARHVAENFDAVFIPFQAMFDEAIKYAPPAHWAADGVHPTPAGASLMANTWLRIVAS
jgi:lysophospholipase L1-like esterase